MKLFYLKSGDVVNELKETKNIETLPTGGHLHYVATISNEISKFGEIFFLSEGTEEKYFNIENVSARTFGSIKFGLVPKLVKKIIAMIRVFLLLVKYEPSHILCSKLYIMPSVFIYSKLFNIPMIVSIHTDMFTKKSIFSKEIDKFILNRVDSIICHGPFLVKQVSDIVKEINKIYEYNAISNDLIDLSTSKIRNKNLENLTEDFIFTYVGRIEESKGVFDLYNAFKSMINTNDKDIILVFAGEGSANEKIKILINDDGLKNNVTLLGKLDRQEIAHLLKNTSVVVTPSRSYFPEGRCMSAMEALVMNIPVIAPNYGPFPYLIKNGSNGLLFKVDDVNDLSNKIKEICDKDLFKQLKIGVKEKNKNDDMSKNTYSSTVKKIILNKISNET
jgi:glycosyltransferase involved in cell wall biosynthesis